MTDIAARYLITRMDPIQISPDGGRSVKAASVAKAEDQQKAAAPIGLGAVAGLLRYPVWDMTFSEYGEHMGWEVPL